MKQNTNRLVTLIDKKTIEKRIAQLGAEITKDYEGKELTVICVLKGAVFFCCDLTRQIKLPTKIEFIRASSYVGEDSTGKVEFKLKLDDDVTDKDVLVVEDIIDTGTTMVEILNYLNEQKPNSLKLCALLDKPERRKVEGLRADYLGFTIPNMFVVGYGLDLDEEYRNLPSVKCITKTKKDVKKTKLQRVLLKLTLC